MLRRLRPLLWPGLVALAALLPLVPGLLPGRTLAWRDSALLQAPVRVLVSEALRDGRLPLWNPLEGLGQPLLGQALHAALHPVSVLTALASPSIDLLLATLVVTAALGAWMAARTLDVDAAPAAVAGLGYGLSGYVLGMTENAHYLTGAATLPWVLAGLRLAGRRPTGWLAGAVAVAAAGLAMDPGALAAGVVGGLVLAADAGGDPSGAGAGHTGGVTRGLARAAAACLLGLALAAVQLVPTLAWLPQTLRGAPALASSQGEQWSLAWTRLPELVAPGLMVGFPRSFHAPVFQELTASRGVPFPWAPGVFVGAPVLVLALVGVRRRTGLLLLALAALFLWIALGRQAGATQLLGGIPVWGTLRYWEKMVAPMTLFLAVGASVGAQAAGEPVGNPPGGNARRALHRLALVGAGVAVAATVPAVLRASPDAMRQAYQGRLVSGLAFAAVSLLALAWWARRPAAGSGWVVALILAQSIAAAPFSLHFGTADALRERPPRLEAPYPGPRIVTPIQTNAESGEGGWDAIDLTHAIAYRTGRSSSNVAAGLENAEAYTGFGSVRSAVLEGAGPLRWKALRRLGVSHVVAAPVADDEDRRELERTLGPDASAAASGPGGIQAWAVPRREWVTVAPAVRALPDTREAARALGAALHRGSTEVILEAPEAPPAGPGTVLSARRSLEAVEVVADCASPCVVVVNDAFAPGWVAEIDGVPAPVLPADVLVRAVAWPAGRHRMVMRYEPPEVRLGVAVSALAAVVVLVAVLVQARRARARAGRA